MLLGAVVIFVLMGVSGSQPTILSGAGYPLVSNLTYASGTIGTIGVEIIRNASNSGQYFQVSTNSSATVNCAVNTTSTGLLGAGMSLASTSGDKEWEMWGARGSVFCIASASSTVSWLYDQSVNP